MGEKNKLVDDYIVRSADFARPILCHLRTLVHKGCPQVEETIKWSFPNFDYKGPFCSMAAFKEHCSFGFWKAAIMKDSEKLKTNQREAMGHLGRIKTVADLPPDSVLLSYIREAVRLNDEGIRLPPRKKNTAVKELIVPADFLKALKTSDDAYSKFERFSPSHRKEYVEWITEAKTESTRNKRIAKALEQITEGKSRHWKYEKPASTR